MAGTIPHKGDINEIVKYLTSQIKKLGVHVELGKEVTLRLVKRLQPEVVVIAIGAHPTIPEIPGIDRPNVCIADDIIAEGGTKWWRGGQLVALIKTASGALLLPENR